MISGKLRPLGVALVAVLYATAHATDLPPPVERVVTGHKLPGASYSLVVHEIGADEALISINADTPRNPASTIKLITTLVALEELGPAYTWQTDVYTLGKLSAGTLDGDLLFKGYGDPYMVTEEFWNLLRTLRRRGLQRITGDLLIDSSHFASEPVNSKSFDGQPYRVYNVEPHPLLINFKSVRFYFYPGTDGKTVAVRTDPELSNLRIDNRLSLSDGPCGGYQRGIAFSLRDTKTADHVVFSGKYPQACGEYSLVRTVMTPTGYAHGLFGKLWHELEGEFSGRVKAATAPREAGTFLTWTSRPLADVITGINKFSNSKHRRTCNNTATQ